MSADLATVQQIADGDAKAKPTDALSVKAIMTCIDTVAARLAGNFFSSVGFPALTGSASSGDSKGGDAKPVDPVAAHIKALSDILAYVKDAAAPSAPVDFKGV